MISRIRVSIFVTILLLVLTLQVYPGSAQIVLSPGRSASIPIKVVLVGFDSTVVDAGYLVWSGSGKNLPSSITNLVLDSGNATGAIFRPQYGVEFASSDFKRSLVGYLNSIERRVNGKNPWFGQYQVDEQNKDYYNYVPVVMDYVVYDANAVEDWLWNHAEELGGFPENGWTIIVAYLPDLPSVTWNDVKTFKNTNGEKLPKSKAHYYGISATDSDLGYVARYRDFMNAWGGHHRMWFVDLSAGPVYNSEWEDLPLQVAVGDNDIKLSTDFGRQWLTEYLADYIWQATYNFIVPNFVYSPQYSPNYRIDIVVLDDRDSSERSEVPIEKTANKDMVTAAFQDLIPYSTISVNVRFESADQNLHNLIKSSYKYTDSWMAGSIFASPERYGVVDVRPIYKYVLDNLATYEPGILTADLETTIIPVFAFAFSGETYFTYTYKWEIGKTDWETGALLGIALKEAVFISMNQWEFTRGDHVDPPQPGKGEGFTSTMIHEVGHMVGLMHPHQYGNIGDFVFSAMGYFTNDYYFGQIDKDALRRAHINQIYAKTEELLAQVAGPSTVGDLASQVRSKLDEADKSYSRMDYADAIEFVLTAYRLAQLLVPTAPSQVRTQVTTWTTTVSASASETTSRGFWDNVTGFFEWLCKLIGMC